MLNKKGERELVYVVKIDDIKPIEGADRVEIAVVGGWRVLVRKNQFEPGDLAIYFEIDSKVPEKPEFEFLAAKHYKIKTQKYFKGTVISQGLLMAAEDFGWELESSTKTIWKNEKEFLIEGDFLTKELGVTYAEAEDNKRKANSEDKYKKMAQRHGKLFSKQPFRWLMKRTWGKKLLFVFFGRKRDKKNAWPAHVVKTDEERIQNLSSRLEEFSNELWYATEKIDGTSTTFSLIKRGKRKFDYYVCSRNVVMTNRKDGSWYETNVYTEMAEKYLIRDVLECLFNRNKSYTNKKDSNLSFVTIQGETYGGGIQKRDYSTSDHYFAAFNLIFGYEDGTVIRLNPLRMKDILEIYDVPSVPIVDCGIPGFATIEEYLDYATGRSQVDGKEREGIVFRSEDGSKSFKAVSNSFLLKYHG